MNLILSSKKILIVDDIEHNITLLTLLLNRQGHDIYSASDGVEAVEQFKLMKPDIIFMDIHMPKMDGLTATQTIRDYESDNQLPRTPIIALTANVELEHKLASERAGMDGFTNKPIDVNVLTEEMMRVLSN